jgi:peptidoglycan/LPS O-acetylase OafA/YrhL
MPSDQRSPKHLPALDGLRGLAVATVVWFHLGGRFGERLVGGYLGVDVFFVLSGYLITSVLLAEHARTGAVSLRNFWIRRARRLLPALLSLMPAIAIYARTFATWRELHGLRMDALATITYVANWRAIHSAKDYWSMFAAPSPLEHTWSLAIEEQFYLVWPLLFILVVIRFKLSRTVLTALMVAFATLSSIAMAVHFLPEATARAYFGTDTRASGILLGAGLAFALEGRSLARFARWLDTLGMVCVLLLCIALTRLDGQNPWLYRGGFVLTELACLVLIACATLERESLVARALATRPLAWLGTLSYGVYLWHWPINCVLTPERVHLGEGALTVCRLGATLLVASVSYRYLEAPIRAHGLGLSGQAKPLAAAAASMISAFGLVVFCTRINAPPTPAPYVPPPPLEADAGPLKQAPDRFSMPDSVLPEAKDLPPGTTRILVLGDSVAIALGMAMRHSQNQAPVFVSERGVGDCSIMESLTIRRGEALGHPNLKHWGCAMNWVSDVAELKPDVTLIVLGGAFYNKLVVDGRTETACGAGWQEFYRARLDQLLMEMGSNAGHVAVARIPYPAPRLVKGGMLADVDCLNGVLQGFANAHKLQLVDVATQICPTRECRVLSDQGQPIRPDGLHPACPGATDLAVWTIQELLKSAP